MSGKYIVIVGGVYSGTGKGISAASIGLLLKMRGVNVEYLKCDPYLNINAGTMSPVEHGECFLCNDGTETDLDLGHIERITGIEMSNKNIFTSGMLFKSLLEEEEEGKYLGSSVQIVPHVTDKIQEKFLEVGKDADVTIVEIGGTVGDFESGALFESVRQFKQKKPNDVAIVMVAPIIWNGTVCEFKTKPLQNSVRSLQASGLQPDLLLCRVDRPLPEATLEKVSRLTGVDRSAVFDAPDVDSIYQVPIEFWNRHVDDFFVDIFQIRRTGCRIHKYKDLVEKYNNGIELPSISIGVVSKYSNCDEAYISLKEALTHAAVDNNVRCTIKWINAEELEMGDHRKTWRYFEGIHGVIVPGGFDVRGVEGKIQAINYVREKKIPFLGICLGLQCAVIEFARNVLKIDDATSQEFKKDGTHVIEFVEGQKELQQKSGTMRLGAYDCELRKNSLVKEVYGRKRISERHRHRYEVAEQWVKDYAHNNFHVSGRNPQTNLIEIMEIDPQKHPFFVGTQAHPEFRSRLTSPAPLFNGLVKSAINYQIRQETKQE